MKTYRYPGAQPFSAEQQHVFFGREADVVRLHRLIKTRPLVVLYAKSGMGKSSLLNAGIVPAVEDEGEYTPRFIRFNAWTEGKSDDPVSITYQTLCPQGSEDTFIDRLIEHEPSIWHALKEAQLTSGGKRKYLLLFDQFEELFTYPPAAIQAFKEQLAEALYTKIPQRYRTVLETQIAENCCTLRDADFDALQTPITVRIVLSIRADRMHLMERLSDNLPDILAHCYELNALNPQQATAALTEPAWAPGNFLSPAFRYSPEAVQKILAFLDDEDGRIETVQLQILCRTFEERALHEGVQYFDAENLGNLEHIIAGFYHRQLAVLGDEAAQTPARRLIEEGLIVADDKQRLTLHEAQINSLFQVPAAHLAKLVDGGLLRAEPALRGGYAYELSHDTLVLPALQARTTRRKAEEEANLAVERHKRRRTRMIAMAFAALSIVSFVAALYALSQTQKAKAALQEAEQQRDEAERQRQLVVQERDRANENQRLAELNAKTALTEKERAELQTLLAQKAREVAETLAGKGRQLEQTLQGDSDTYRYLIQRSRQFFQEGDYRNALTYAATARFLQATPDAHRWVETARAGMAADALLIAGDLDKAEKAYATLASQHPNSTAAQRVSQIGAVRQALSEESKGSDPRNVHSLSLRDKGLGVVPTTLMQYPNIADLDLSGNRLDTLGAALWQLRQLRSLDLSVNNLRYVPTDIVALGQLKQLLLSENELLVQLPTNLGQLHQLQTLDLRNTPQLRSLPTSLSGLAQLHTLHLSKTPLASLPPTLSYLKNLRTLTLSDMGLAYDQLSVVWALEGLEELSLSNNGLTALPADISRLRNLKRLDLSFNELRTLPDAIGQLTNLQILDLNDNVNMPESERMRVQALLPNCRIVF